MNICMIGGAGFIGMNLAIAFSKDIRNLITIVDTDERFLLAKGLSGKKNVVFRKSLYRCDSDFDQQVTGQDIIFHLASTNIPGDSNHSISDELEADIITTAKLLDACVRQKVGKVVFISSGGAVYGKGGNGPMDEEMPTYPITSYGIQKITIEKMLYLYQYQYGLDYSVIRLANPYGPYQRPNGRLGVITTFIYKALTDGSLEVYGDGSVVRDFIYIDDAIEGICNITTKKSTFPVYNLGTGKGISINSIIMTIKKNIRSNLQVRYLDSRNTDVPVNYLNIGRYENEFGKIDFTSLETGIEKTADFLREYYCSSILI